LDEADYATGVRVSDAEFDAIHITRDKFHGDWNYRVGGAVRAITFL
jgi:hypothetical protein